MRLSITTLLIAGSANAFVNRAPNSLSSTTLRGYLDDFSEDLAKPIEPEYDPDTEDREKLKLPSQDIVNAGPGNLETFVEFDEFDGGDGQMGVAGDGQQGLDKIGSSPTMAKSMAKSNIMSAKNAWGTSTGYADELREKGVETSRAQQFENWGNQRQVWRKQQAVREMEAADTNAQSAELDWRELASFGVERNQDFSLDETFGDVSAGDEIEDTISFKSMINKFDGKSILLKNQFMGFADFRASFTSASGKQWSVSPMEGSMNAKEDTEFIVRFRPSKPEVSEGYLVIETEDFKKTYKVIGSTS